MGVSDVLGFWMGWWWWWWECGSFENIDRKYRNSIPKHKVPFVCFKSVVVRTHLVNWINAMTRSPVCFSPFVAKMRMKKCERKYWVYRKWRAQFQDPLQLSLSFIFYSIYTCHTNLIYYVIENRSVFLTPFSSVVCFFPGDLLHIGKEHRKRRRKCNTRKNLPGDISIYFRINIFSFALNPLPFAIHLFCHRISRTAKRTHTHTHTLWRVSVKERNTLHAIETELK